MSEPAVISRNDPFGSMPQLRSRIAANPDWYGLNALETKTVRSAALAAGATTLLTATTKKRTRLAGGVLFLHNPTAAGITFDLHAVPSGGSAGSTNKMRETLTLAVNEARSFVLTDLWHVLMPGEALVINTGASGINVWGQALEERQEIAAYIGGFAGNLGVGDSTLITVPALRSLAVKSVLAFNPTAGALTLSLNARASGAAAADSNQFIETSIGAGASYQFDVGLMVTLAAGGIVSARGSAAGLNVWTSGALW